MTGLLVFFVVMIVLSIAICFIFFGGSNSPVSPYVAFLVCAIGVSLLTWLNWAKTYKDDRWVVCNVTEKDRGGDNGSYRIYTSDCGQLENKDSKLRWKLNSADIWQEIPSEGPVKLRIAGSRNGFFSVFPNVFDVEPID